MDCAHTGNKTKASDETSHPTLYLLGQLSNESGTCKRQISFLRQDVFVKAVLKQEFIFNHDLCLGALLTRTAALVIAAITSTSN